LKILVYGGTFDPPHKGHAALLKAAVKAARPDLTLVVPNVRNPLKTDAPLAGEERAALCKLGLLDSQPHAWLDLSELEGGKPAFTVDTLARLSRSFPGARLDFLTGWDSALSFSRWKDTARLKRLARWWTARRPGSSGALSPHFRVLPGLMPDVSATEIRARLLVGDDVSGLVAPAVADYLEKKGLYGLSRVEELRGMLSPSRFEHSRCVGRLAGALARRWGLDEGKALLAGLLHDCGRSVPVPRMGAYAKARKLRVPALTQTARQNPVALHAHISEDLCRRRFKISDREVLSAVRKHTLADAVMSPLDRLLYVADCCSADRTYPEAAGLRKLAFDDLDEAARACMANKIRWCVEDGKWLHPLTLTAWNSLTAS
jgi:nicotinate-nucleotide adenylyltransferase